jgi:hypothetical protein
MDSVEAHYALVMLQQYYVFTTCILTDVQLFKQCDDLSSIISQSKYKFVHVFSECIATLLSVRDDLTQLKDNITNILQKENASISIQFYYNFNNTLLTDARVLEIYNSLTNYFQPIKTELLYKIESFIAYELDIFKPKAVSFTSNLIFLLNFLETIFTFTLTNNVTKHMGLPAFFTYNVL